jgi:hypothetical protein
MLRSAYLSGRYIVILLRTTPVAGETTITGVFLLNASQVLAGHTVKIVRRNAPRSVCQMNPILRHNWLPFAF